MLAPEAFAPVSDETDRVEQDADASRHPHRRPPTIERHRRPAPPKPDQACLAPLTRAGRAREAQRA